MKKGEAPAPSGGGWMIGLAATVVGLGLATGLVWVGLSADDEPPAPVVIERPPPQKKVVVPQVVNPAPVEPEPPPSPVPAPLPLGQKRWPCSSIVDVTPLKTDMLRQNLHFAVVTFDRGNPLIVFIESPKPAKLKQLSSRRDVIAACKAKGEKELLAAKVDESHPGFRTAITIHFGGDVVALEDLSVR
jgi:hypothetical protein